MNVRETFHWRQLSPSTLLVPGIDRKSSGSAARALTCQASCWSCYYFLSEVPGKHTLSVELSWERDRRAGEQRPDFNMNQDKVFIFHLFLESGVNLTL